MSALTHTDLAVRARLGINAGLLERAPVRRVDDREARQMLELDSLLGQLDGVKPNAKLHGCPAVAAVHIPDPRPTRPVVTEFRPPDYRTWCYGGCPSPMCAFTSSASSRC